MINQGHFIKVSDFKMEDKIQKYPLRIIQNKSAITEENFLYCQPPVSPCGKQGVNMWKVSFQNKQGIFGISIQMKS